MFELKHISAAGVPRAIEKAERYRFLNQPWAAESICRDVLGVEPDNQQALVILLLALTDQIVAGMADGVAHAREVLPRLRDEYKRAYYAGIICERRGKAQLDHANPGAAAVAYEWFREAMGWYERAEAIRPAGNDDAILRWNTCARLLNQFADFVPRESESYEPALED